MASDAALDLIVNLKDNASKGLGAIAKSGGFLKDALSFATGGLIQKGIETIAGSVGDFFSGAIDEAQGWNKAFAQTQAVLKSTGGAAGLTADQMADLADSLSGANGMSLAADDAVLAGENLLATFTNIKGGVFKDATKTMVDMGAALGTDVAGGAVQLGKALNDPIAGIGALSRVGVTFTNDQKKMIKTMVQAGDVEGAQKVILAELNKEFGGSAKAAADADGGMFQLSEGIANLKQGVGDALLPILRTLVGFANSSLIPAIGKVLGVVGDFGAVLVGAFSSKSASLDLLQKLPGWLQPLGKIVGDLVGNFGEFFDAIGKGQNPLSAFGDLIKNNFTDVFTNLKTFVPQALGAIGTFLSDVWAGLTGSDQGTKGQASFGTLAGQWILGIGTGLVAKAQEAIAGVGTFLSGFWQGITDQPFQADGITGFAGMAGQWVLGIGEGLLAAIPGVLTAIGGFFTGLWTGLTGGETDPTASGAAQFGTIAGGWIAGIGTGLMGALQAAWTSIGQFFTGFWTGLTGGSNGDPMATGAAKFGEMAGGWVAGIGSGLLGAIQTAWTGLGTFLGQFWGGLTGGGGGGESESKTGGGELAFATAAGQWVLGIGTGLVGALRGALDSLGTFLADFWKGLTGQSETDGKDSFGTATGTWVHGIADGFNTWLTEAQKWQAKFLADLWADLTNQDPTGRTKFKTSVGEWTRGVEDGFQTNQQQAQDALGLFAQKIWFDLTNKHNEAGRTNFALAVGEWVGSMNKAFILKAVEILTPVQTFFQSIWDSLTGKGGHNDTGKQNFWETANQSIIGFVNGVTDNANKISASVSGMIRVFLDGIKKGMGISSPSTEMAAFGPDIAQGFINGVTDAWWRVTQGIANLVAQIPEPIRKFLGIGSPSKLMFALGSDTGEGFNLGLLSQIPGLQTTVGQWGTTLTGGVTGLLPQVQQAGQGLLNSLLAPFLSGKGLTDGDNPFGKQGGNPLDSIVGGFSAMLKPDGGVGKGAPGGGAGGPLAPISDAIKATLQDLATQVQFHATLSNEGSIAYWWAGVKGLIPLMEKKVDQGSDSLKAYMGPAWKGVFDYIAAEWSLQIPALEGEWRDFLHDLEQAAQTTANNIAKIMGSIPTVPGGGTGGGTAPLPPGSPGTSGGLHPGGSGGGVGGIHTSAAVAGGGNFTIWALFPGLPPMQGQATTSASEALRWQQEMSRLPV